MKNMSKFIAIRLLALVARAVIHRYHPRIVMVTGSVGKTSTKDAVAAVFTTRFLVRSSEKSFNSEFGVPFTILGVKNPWEDPLSWLVVMKRTLALLLLPNHYPTMLVLEVGAEKPGDLAHILGIVTPDMVVVTRLPEVPVHVEAYASPEEVREEEFSPAYALPVSAPLVIPADDHYALSMAARTPARIISYGESDGANVRVSDIGFCESGKKVVGMRATVTAGDAHENVAVKGSVGTTHLLPIAAAIAAATAFDIPLPEAFKALDMYEPPPGRSRLLAGKNGSVIIDESYNSSPAAMEEALATLKAFPGAKRRIAVLGDMLELGRYSVLEHERIGALVNESADVIATVGIRARAFALTGQTAAPKSGEVLPFDNSRAAALSLSGFVRAGDVILVKGSQSMRTERIVEALLADPADVSLLVRQEPEWKRKL